MNPPPLDPHEIARLESLRSLEILDTLPEERFDRVTRLAKRLFDVPIALVNLIDADRQWFKSRIGLTVREMPREISFCAHTIQGEGLMVVPDLSQDARFKANPLVYGATGIRFYAGHPLRAADGGKVGTFCIMGVEPRTLDAAGRESLLDLARIAERELIAGQIAMCDELTGLPNRRGFELLGQHALNVCKRIGKPASLVYFDLNDFKKVNEAHGRLEGDFALTTFASVLRTVMRDTDVLARVGSDEFVALLTQADADQSAAAVARFTQALLERSIELDRGYRLGFTSGQVAFANWRHPTIGTMVGEAAAALRESQQERASAL
jgi:diguanylate cyclase (GGDEF)-like protein